MVRNGRKKRQAEWDMLELRESIMYTGSMLEVAGRHSFPSGTVFCNITDAVYLQSVPSGGWPQMGSVVSYERCFLRLGTGNFLDGGCSWYISQSTYLSDARTISTHGSTI